MNIAVHPKARASDGRPSHIAEAEWRVRLDLAAFYRLVSHFGMAQLVFNHITARVPDEAGHFLINPYGLHYDEVTASNLVKVDYDGRIVDGSGSEINPAGFIIHSCVHRARKDVHCVAHTHSRAGVAVSCLKEGLTLLNQEAMMFHNKIAYHDYEGIAVDPDEQQRLVGHLGHRAVLMLRNHGLLVAAESVPQAFRYLYFLEQSCRLLMDVLSAGRPFNAPGEALMDKVCRQFEDGVAATGTGGETREWAAMLRMMDRKDPSWRD
jgi:ribulose-5-phosphate 4-epimerase/fuculose-1-phosphate aldolase